MTASEIQMGVARADEAWEQKQREFLRPLVDAHLAVLDARTPRLIANSAEADRVNLLWEKGLLWESDSGKLSADPPAPKPGKFREFLQRKADEAVRFGQPEIPVTEEMIKAAIQARDAAPSIHWNDMAPAIYRAMAAVAPVELVSAAEDRIAALEAEKAGIEQAMDILCAGCRRENRDLVARVAALESECEELRDQRMVRADEVGSHPYHGPTETVPHPDIPDRTVQRAVPDPVHEQFHKTVGDVMAGNVMRPARDQMEKALADAKAKDGKAPQPIRSITRSGDPRIGGWHG